MNAAASNPNAWEKIYSPTFPAHEGMYWLWDACNWVFLAVVDDFGDLVKVIA
jgi:hypothetical protein